MRYVLSFVVLLLGMASLGFPQWKTISRLSYDWKNNGTQYGFIMEKPQRWDDPGDFVRLRIESPQHHEFSLVDSGGLVKISGELENNRLLKRNIVRSEYLYFSRDLRNKRDEPVLILFGFGYGSSPGTVHILELDSMGMPFEVFNQEFGISHFEDLDGDGYPEIIGTHCMTQEWGTCFETYTPISVYKLPPAGMRQCVRSLELSQIYNLKHYCGWAGPDCSYEIAVVKCTRDGKPIIIDAKEAERLYK